MFFQKYSIYFSLVLVVVMGLVSWSLYMQKTEMMQQSYQNEREEFYKQFHEQEKSALMQRVEELKKSAFTQSQELEQKATYKLTQQLDTIYEHIHALYERYKSVGDERMQQKVIDLLEYGVSANMQDTIFLSDFQTNIIYSYMFDMSAEEFSQYQDKDGRSIALELLQKVQKYSQTYVYTTTPEENKQLIYAKKLDLFDWYIAQRVDLSKEYKEFEENFSKEVGYLAMQAKEFAALYDKNKELFVYTKKGAEFDATYIDTVAKHLMNHNSWYKNELDNNQYYSVYIDPIDKYLIYAVSKGENIEE